MMSTWLRRLAPAALLLVLTVPVHGQRLAWWKNEQFQRDLGLTADQSSRIDAVFQATVPHLRATKEDLDRREAELSKLIEANADEATVARQVDKVEATRASLNKMRTLMYLHMRQIMTPDQRARFNALHDQFVKEHRPSRDAK